jgi:uncharacterized repeat protein (TIGR01451 family)
MCLKGKHRWASVVAALVMAILTLLLLDQVILQAANEPAASPAGPAAPTNGPAFTAVVTDQLVGVTGVSAWGDYDNDGDLDILLTGYYYDWDVMESVRVARVYRNDGGDTFVTTITTDTLSSLSKDAPAWGDYDNDSDLDILLPRTGEFVTIYRNDGSDTFTLAVTDTLMAGLDLATHSAAWGDYDNDGDLDILLAGYDGSTRVTEVWRNDGGGSFSQQSTDPSGVSYGSVAWGDYDNDGDLDILLAGYNGLTRVTEVWRNDGAGSFSRQSTDPTGVMYSSVAWGDYDDDDDLDILLAGYDGSTPVTEVWRNEDCADLAIAKSVIPEAVAPGQTITYTLSFSNAGGVTAVGVIITDVVPVGQVANLSYVSSGAVITPTGGVSYTWQVEDLSPGSRGIITITGVLSMGIPSGHTFTNTATITTTVVDDDPANDSSAVGVTVANAAPLAVDDTAATDEDTPVIIGVLANDSDANGDALFVAAVGVPNYGSAIISGTAQVVYTPTNRPASYTAVFTYTASDGSLSDTATVTVAVTADAGADLSLTKAVTPTVAAPRQAITYTLTFVNDGPDPASGVVITDVVPISVTNVSYTSSGAVITPTGGVSYTWQVEDLSPGSGGVITITGVLSTGLPTGVFTNTATITTTAVDEDTANNSTTASITACYDFSGDGQVDIADIQAVASRWRTSCANPDPDNNPATPNYDSLYDIDGDCDIDIVDIMLLVLHWGETCP